MKRYTGMLRKIDELGRIVLPIELRRSMGIEEKDYLEISVDGDNIILCKFREACIFCDSVRQLREYRGKYICIDCYKHIRNQL